MAASRQAADPQDPSSPFRFKGESEGTLPTQIYDSSPLMDSFPDMPPLVDRLPDMSFDMPPLVEPPLRFEELDMPPLVDNPNPSMTFTFATDMTPIALGHDLRRFDAPPEDSVLEVIAPPPGPNQPPIMDFKSFERAAPSPERSPHSAKSRHEPGYIPRPPNAFILFRSSFIRSYHTPGKTPANNATLSKMIGKVWKGLPREEREQWEAKAVQAQAEHRKKYPDWRFRPGANALAKMKVKDGPTRKRKGRGDAEEDGRGGRERDKRERKGGGGDANPSRSVRTESTRRLDEEDAHTAVRGPQAASSPGDHRLGVPQAFMPPAGASPSVRFEVPLTSMFRRSSSAPASDQRAPFSSPTQAHTNPIPLGASMSRRKSIAAGAHLDGSLALSPLRTDVSTSTNLVNSSTSTLDGMLKDSSCVTPPLIGTDLTPVYNGAGVSPPWSLHNLTSASLPADLSGEAYGRGYDYDSPTSMDSPISHENAFDYMSSPTLSAAGVNEPIAASSSPVAALRTGQSMTPYSRYSSLEDWAGHQSTPQNSGPPRSLSESIVPIASVIRDYEYGPPVNASDARSSLVGSTR